MHRNGQCKCLNCAGFYVPDARNRVRQKYCAKPACRQRSKVASQTKWRAKPGNEDREDDQRRVREWRAANPGYWRRKGSRAGIALRDSLNPQVSAGVVEAKQDDRVALQDILKSQDPLVLGLVMHVADIALREDIAGMTQKLISKGRAVMGGRPAGPTYEKQDRDGGTGAARAVAI
jgi:hypothetical protein